MKTFLEEPEEWVAMGKAATTRAQSHSLNHTSRAHEDYYRMLIEKQVSLQ